MADGFDRLARVAGLDDAALGEALRGLGDGLASPPAAAPGSPDIALRVRVRIVSERVAPSDAPRWRDVRRGRRGLVLALLLLLTLAATAGAIGLGVPGIRILLGPVPTPIAAPTTAPGASADPSTVPGVGLGLGLGLGERIADADLVARTSLEALGFVARRPADPEIGAADATFVVGRRLTLAWAPSPGLPATTSPGVGLLITEFRGSVDPGYLAKIAGPGTLVDRVGVDGVRGYWISGEVHGFFSVDENGNVVQESRRLVGDTLLWSVDGVTYRLEIAAGLERALEIAASLN